MLRAALAAAAAFAMADVCEGDGVCLLSLRHQVQGAASKGTQAALVQVQERRAVLAQWQSATAHLRESVFQDPDLKALLNDDGMRDFIRNQERSDDMCSAKQLEAKRSLDGLLHSVKQLSAEIEAETEVVTSNTEILEDALNKKKRAESSETACKAECSKTKLQAEREDLGSLQRELAEMKNIANPDVRSHVKMDVDYKELAREHAEEAERKARKDAESMSDSERAQVQKNLGFLQTEHLFANDVVLIQTQQLFESLAQVVADTRKCRAFASAVVRAGSAAVATDDCDDKRKDLQKEFTKAYLAIADLYDRKVEELKQEHEECETKCTNTFTETDQSVKDEIKEATENIAKAKDTIEDLEPMLEEAKQSVERLRAHVKELEGSCKIGSDVSKHLSKIRQLITDLEECPGKNDFSLNIPEWTPKAALIKKV